MVKVAYNAWYGGFSLSRAAVLLGRKISGDSLWAGPCLKGDRYSDGTPVDNDYAFVRDIDRHDPVLIRVIEDLGEAANGPAAQLCIEEIPSGAKYRIDEYDGMESVMTIDDYDWKIAQ